jgi:hypothetical protein
MRPIPTIYIFGDDPVVAASIEQILASRFTTTRVVRALMPFGDSIPVSTVLTWARTAFRPFIEKGSLIVGLGLGGLIACALQEKEPDLDLSVIAVNAPLWDGTDGEDAVELAWNTGPSGGSMRIAIYSSLYGPYRYRAMNIWQSYADEAFDLPWLQHGIDLAKHAVCYLIATYLRDGSIRDEVTTVFPSQKTEDSAH